MIRRTIFCVLFAVTTTVVGAQNISGSWNGKLEIGQLVSLSIVFNFGTDDSGKPVCTMDSPDQNTRGIAAEVVYMSPDSVNIRVPGISATYKGRLYGNVIKGLFTQMGQAFRLDLLQGEIVRSRPQTPCEPFPYVTEDVTFAGYGEGTVLAGTITYPAGYDGKYAVPMVVMVSGSGQQNRDEELFGHKPFLVIADYLARNGIASLRYDDRGVGQSTGDVTKATTADFMEDAAVVLDSLRKLDKKFSHVGVLGHSEGGTIAFMLAARDKADFIVSMAGTGVCGDTVIAEQNNILLARLGSAERVDSRQIRMQAEADTNSWIKYFASHDPSSDIASARCPVMAINGSMDKQVTPATNLSAIKRLLPANKRNMIKEYAGLNHLFQHCKTGMPEEYKDIEETISPEVLSDIAEWINTCKRLCRN